MTGAADIKDRIRAEAKALGFDSVGFAAAVPDPKLRERLALFLAEGQHGEMGWMEANADRRADPLTLWPEARTVLSLGLNYGPAEDPLPLLQQRGRGAISVYAQGRDYHDVVKKKLKALGGWIHRSFNTELKVFVDTAPVMEKPLAMQAGIGWQGKHTNLVSRDYGSWLFLGEIYLAIELPPDAPERDHCGSCRACLDSCPTAAFPTPYRLDARRCISYLTIEHKGPIPHELRPLIGNRIYGCDDCLAVCPWNKFAEMGREAALAPRPELNGPALASLLGFDDAGFRAAFAGSPIKRIGRDRFLRNVLVAVGNSGDAALAPLVEPLLDDAAATVRGAAVWALSRLLGPAGLRRLASARSADPEAEVREEWRVGIAAAN
ncbi:MULTISPECIES: tRNA epoxyqueuosine(34) reductase QueG [Inquilinus]|uniref:Epoxyqueuosine reductase n=1 Tax=Inquilinus ginsengisoli TaxID=363840 RepID=A0ABU1JUU2_9PROT|nr:tRNA epoxyqueuosine(34) reductase QueG [Inquilinus ginsengisoli]MDR6291330.1 epoxyqueuosine reductase [Inquilinus ginsengisoli]